ncbi:arogenate dehydrogenase 1, chloroplastic-like isoform X2 [Panicum virgatum]|uniref:arogenate dehydrogenase 1, chloroplastic-like isoform X2 n=1 Tax=Panicum virgatum TaxID=38727 RepID=UPI0019D547E6|nr:arogenate dehydrogenase 1, chloroplastic-like isoform X2 [Panicum virgatum]
MASSLRHFAGPACIPAPAPASAGAGASGATCLLRRYTPDFCAFAALRPIRPAAAFSAANPLASPAEHEQRQQQQQAVPCHDGDPPAPSPSPSPPPPPPSPAPAPLRVGIVGFGNFGQFIAGGIQRQGHAVLAASRSDYSDYCAGRGIPFFTSVDALCEEQPDVLLICSSILSTEAVVRAIPFHKLRPDTIVADVLSVKQFPRNLLLEGCRMVEMSCAEHDRYAAGSQFITHTIGRVLSQLNLKTTPINTKGYESLLQLTHNTVSDSFDLYYGLFMYNINATEQLDNLERAFESVRQMLYGRLHDLLRKQIVERVPVTTISSEKLENSRSNSFATSPLSPIITEENKHVSSITSVASPTNILQPTTSSTG